MKSTSEFFYTADVSVNSIQEIILKYSNRVFENSNNLYISTAKKPKGYKAVVKNPILSKGARSWFATVFIQIASSDDNDSCYLKFNYSQTLIFNLSKVQLYLLTFLVFVLGLTTIRFKIFELSQVLPVLSSTLIAVLGVLLFSNIQKWGKEEQQTEIRLAVLKLLKSEGVTLKRIANS